MNASGIFYKLTRTKSAIAHELFDYSTKLYSRTSKLTLEKNKIKVLHYATLTYNAILGRLENRHIASAS